MSKAGWLQLNEYSSKYKVSVSTLRRRIKAGEVEHFFEGGKYWLKDAIIEKYVRNRPTAPAKPALQMLEEPAAPLKAFAQSEVKDLGFVETTHELLGELKNAYVVILQEKEEQILQLKEEVADLKTLVRILEAENEKFKAREVRASEMGWSIED